MRDAGIPEITAFLPPIAGDGALGAESAMAFR